MIDGDDLAYKMIFSHADEAIDEYWTKLGGQPVWLEKPQWPRCWRHERLMGFIGQFRLPGRQIRMAYLFMDNESEESWSPEGGENALIVQPGRIPPFVQAVGAATGESLVNELFVDLEEIEQSTAPRWGSQMLGTPTWWQDEEYPAGVWTYFFQLRNSENGMYDTLFAESGAGYGFLSPDEQEGRFLWQC
ncbi:hypothetical protein ETD86_06410 [Nonomuraea turkmeniaca]|uniref:DUF1963 domain-containing protein n=1 Tax=Nonomuraea turkmeniaca TaxID=103838 RepID=A0A5S4FU88_9ACTN|nr:hypothetical protein [Nonomuraea turkmeniaca]TMR23954.1 hypothetical protein ETD86_06410 [Nonomuraea turkmeniaca]